MTENKMRIFRERWAEDRKAQSAMFDALLFFILMLISSGIILYYTANVQQPVVYTAKADRNLQFTQDLLVAFLTSTVNDTSYEIDDEKIVLEDEAIVEIIMEIIFIKKYNTGDYDCSNMTFMVYMSLFNLTHVTRTNDPQVVSSGINQTTYHFFLQARYDPIDGSTSTIQNFPDHEFEDYGDFDLFPCLWKDSTVDYPKDSFGSVQRMSMLNDQYTVDGSRHPGNLTIELKLWKA